MIQIGQILCIALAILHQIEFISQFRVNLHIKHSPHHFTQIFSDIVSSLLRMSIHRDIYRYKLQDKKRATIYGRPFNKMERVRGIEPP
jgi:hypothetical protein